MAPLPRRGSGPRRLPRSGGKGASLSPWHLLAAALVALVGTGIIAAVDRTPDQSGDVSYAAANATQAKQNPSPALSPAQVRAPPIVEAPRASAPASAQLATAPAEPQETASTISLALRPEPPPAPANVMPAPAAVDIPDTTASFAAPAPPTRPSPSPAVPAALARAPVGADGRLEGGCMPDELRAVLADVSSRFGKVAVVSTNELHTGNHTAGSFREKLHHDCKAVDFRPERGRIDEIAAYLRSRPEVAGINRYRNGVVHMDLNEGSRVAAKRPRRQVARRAAETTAAESAETLPAPPPPPSVFAPAVPDRDH